MLQKERQQREDAERQRIMLEEKVRRFEAEAEETKEGLLLCRLGREVVLLIISHVL
jgi:hypothetical protein